MTAALLLISAAAALQGAPGLAYKAGESWILDVTQELSPADAASTDEKHVFEFRVGFKVLESGDKGTSVETSRILTSETFDGIKLPPPKGAKPLLERFTLGPESMFGFEYARYLDPAELRLSRLTWIVPPKEPKVRWILQWPTIEPDWAPAAEMAFEQPDKQPSPVQVTYSFRFKEFGVGSRIQGEGHAIFERKTMSLVRLEGSFRNVPMPGGEGPHNLKLLAERR